MKLNESYMRSVLKEEYDKRLNYFLNEKMTLTTKYGANVIEDAAGLKVYDKAGFRYTFAGIVKKEDNTEFAKLILPEEPLGNELGSSSSPLLEDDELGGRGIGFISRKSGSEREIEFDTASSGEFDNYRQEDVIDKSDKEEKLGIKKEPKYILVPMGEFEERFSIN
jgi:hypothetical protein